MEAKILTPPNPPKGGTGGKLEIIKRQINKIKLRFENEQLSAETVEFLNGRMVELIAAFEEAWKEWEDNTPLAPLKGGEESKQVTRIERAMEDYRLLKALKKVNGVFRLPQEADVLVKALQTASGDFDKAKRA